MLNILLALVFIVTRSNAHSWVSCTNYQINSTADQLDYKSDLCKGFPRSYSNFAQAGFGLEAALSFQAAGGIPCNTRLASPYSSAYSTAYPMAQYYPGQNVCIAWSPQGHVSATCNNVATTAPDQGTRIYVSVQNPTVDVPTSDMTLVKNLGTNTQIDGFVGYQNCPKFCSDKIKALCTGCFTVPTTLQSGSVYTFVWSWAFNSINDLYSTCWEAQIVQPPPKTESVVSSARTPCTSNEQCPSKSCQVDGTCYEPNGTATVFAVIFAILLVAAIIFIVALVQFPKSLPGFLRPKN